MIDVKKNNNLRGLVHKIMVCHVWVDNALQRVERCYSGALDGGDTRGLSIIGESGTGKSRILEHVEKKYPRSRDDSGLKVPVLLVKVPSKPTVKGLVEVLLHELGDPLFEKGTEIVKTKRLLKLLAAAETRLLMLDEFQHFVDRTSQKVQHQVADWLKILVDDAQVGLIVAGLPYCTHVIETNTQLKRRFQRSAIMPRFDWSNSEHQVEFCSILGTMQSQLIPFEFPDLSSIDMAFRIYCATGGIIGRVANLLTETITNAIYEDKIKITLSALRKADEFASYDKPFDMESPFSKKFNILPSDEIIKSAMQIGSMEDHKEINSLYRNYKPSRSSDIFSI